MPERLAARLVAAVVITMIAAAAPRSSPAQAAPHVPPGLRDRGWQFDLGLASSSLGNGCFSCSGQWESSVAVTAAAGYQWSRDLYVGAELTSWSRSGMLDGGQELSESVLGVVVRHYPIDTVALHWSAGIGWSHYDDGLTVNAPAVMAKIGWPFRVGRLPTLVPWVGATDALVAHDGIRPSLLSLGLAVRWY